MTGIVESCGVRGKRLHELKRIWAKLLPKQARPALKAARTEDALHTIAITYFPVLEQWDRPVRFTVATTLQGTAASVRDVWTGQGLGDCGFDFQLNHRYLVYANWNAATGRYVTSICTCTREDGEKATPRTG